MDTLVVVIDISINSSRISLRVSPETTPTNTHTIQLKWQQQSVCTALNIELSPILISPILILSS